MPCHDTRHRQARTTAHDCSGVYFQQNYPITLTGDWTPIGIAYANRFKGHYNGGGNAISGLTVSGSYEYAGLFGYTSNMGNQCALQNIIVKDCNIDVSGTADSYAGGIVGYASDDTFINNCRVSDTVKAHKSAGGIAGYLWTITNGHVVKMSQCFADVTVATATYKGKLFGRGENTETYDPSVFNSKTSHYHADGSGVTAFGQGADNTYTVPVYAVTSQTSGLTVAETNAPVTFNDTRYFAANATVTLTADADKAITAFTATGADNSTVATDKHSATVTLGSSDVTVTATLQTISGTCGTGLTWSMSDSDSNGTYDRLTLSGNGTLSTSPWNTDFAANITRVDVSSADITISGNPFSALASSTIIVVPTLDYAVGYVNAGFASQLRTAFGSYHFGVTTEGGTAAYAIATEQDLRNLAAVINANTNATTAITGSGKTFRQTAPITMSSTNFTPIGAEGSYGKWFSGTYDGGDKTISGLTVSTNKQYAGLFGMVDGGTVKNVRLISPTVNSNYNDSYYYAYAGALVGYTEDGSKVENCLVFSPTVSASNNKKYVGAIVGELSYPSDKLTNSLFYSTTNNYGLYGKRYESSTVTNSGRARRVTLGDNVTIQTAMADDLGFSYSGTDYWREGAELTLSNTLSNTLGDAPAGYEYTYTATAGTIDGSTLTVGTADATVTVSATLTVIPWSGEGTQSKPWVIRYPSQLDLLASRVNGTNGETPQEDGYFGKYFELGADITYSHGDDANLAKYESNYTAIGGAHGGIWSYFRGNFDGRGHTVSGIRIYKGGTDESDRYQGLFGYTDYGATIRGITLADARITGYNATGGIVGYNSGSSTVSHCHVAASVAIHAVQNYAKDYGGIVGFNDNQATVSYCTSAATLTKTSSDGSESGGIVGINWGGTLSHNLAIGAVVPADGDNCYGAICGWNRDGTLQNNYYLACTVAGVENATDAGCGIAHKIGDFTYYYYSADVTDDYDAVPALRDNADNSTALALLAALATAGLDGSPLDLGWGAGKYPMQLAGRKLYKDGAWNTLVLPFNVTIADSPLAGAEARPLSAASITGTTLNLTFGDDIVNPVFQGVTVSSTTAGSYDSGTGDERVRFLGTYDQKTIAGEDQSILFLSAGNTLYYPSGLNGGVTINPFRAYFKIGEDETMARQLTAFNLSFGDSSESTGIVEITNPAPSPIPEQSSPTRSLSPTGVGRAAWYTLDGRRLDGKPTKRGLYVHGGRKVVVH